ncbi:iron-containing alcohol dehydrogenase [Aestuariispira insulae]|uniref:Alcohol dehydrogenase 2 n=1 Tax=Aestuariispira insulae TaxID=1461337 RepID=A0A3D9HHV9_9PROT|nr:iron-containing alcohol dehydrogenase [Aestuariispira insulae]RED49058.1 hypothetical protein DFP90_10635 [Aestuariispira insulae]
MSGQSNLNGNWNYPTAMRFGAGRIAELADCCKALGMENPLLVTDPGLAALPMIGEAMAIVEKGGLKVALFSEIKGNPTGKNVADGVDAFNAGGHDGIIAFGGGSALDAAKAIALVAKQGRPVFDFVDEGDNWLRADEAKIAPVVAVPTTSGTGSEVGRASVITDEDNHIKRIIFHPKMLPALVLADPALTVGLPPHVTAATGMDALSHNLEAYCAPGFHPMAIGIAVEGIRLVNESLVTACEDGANIDARAKMMAASAMGATAFQIGLGGMHSLAHPLGALYDAHHGMLNAVVMPYILVANRSSIETRIAELARSMGLEDQTFDGFLNWVLDLRERIGIPHTLAEIGIDDAQAEKVGQMAVNDPTAGTNPIPFSAEEYANIFRNAVNGTL